eukprot:Opistho-2@35665
MPVVKQGHMLKRAQGKSAFTFKKSWQRRLFVLTEQLLQYYEGEEPKPDKMKGSVPVCTIKCVEQVDEDAFNRKHMIQIVHGENENHLILYTVAADEADRDDWINKLRTCCRHNPSLQDRFHPGAYLSSSWTCCNSDTFMSWGCQDAFNYTPDANGQLKVRAGPEVRTPDLGRGRSLVGSPRETRQSVIDSPRSSSSPSTQRSSRAAPAAAAASEFTVVALYTYTAA